MNPLTAQYIEAFESCYPGKKVELKRRGRNHFIVIDGDQGEQPLDDNELKFAIENFQRGKGVSRK